MADRARGEMTVTGRKHEEMFGKPWLLVIITLSLLLLLVLACAKKETPTNSGLKFIQPVYDIEGTSDFEGGNEIVRVYHQIEMSDEEMDRVEYNIIFRDEDAPIGDKIYDEVRKNTWGRIADIETIVVYRDRETGNVESIEFPTTYSEGQEFFTTIPQHYSESIDTPTQDIYINTWNHMFAEYDTNPDLDKYAWNLEDGHYRCENGLVADFVKGSRQDAETWAKGD